jgi:hypothetical protein
MTDGTGNWKAKSEDRWKFSCFRHEQREVITSFTRLDTHGEEESARQSSTTQAAGALETEEEVS